MSKPLVFLVVSLFLSGLILTFFESAYDNSWDVNPRKYSRKSKLKTISPLYKVEDSQTTLEEVTYYMGNQEFLRDVGLHWDFEIDDSEELKKANLSCIPETFGYSKKKGNLVFPEYKYPSCKKSSSPLINLNYLNNTFSMKCPRETEGIYLLEPENLQRSLHIQTEYKNKWKIKTYKGQTEIETEEYAFAGCGDELTHASYYPRFNQTVYNSTLTRMQEIASKTLTFKKPQIVFFLTIDSYSRRHFYRKLPETVSYLSSLKNSSYSVFDFKLHNVYGSSSIDNMFPVFSSNS